MMWFEFKDGSNPYGVWDNRQDEFFRMIVAWNPVIINDNTFYCVEPTKAYYGKVDYQFKKNALRNFAIDWQANIAGIFDLSYGELSWWQTFFETYGKRYGLLKEFRENCIC